MRVEYVYIGLCVMFLVNMYLLATLPDGKYCTVQYKRGDSMQVPKSLCDFYHIQLKTGTVVPENFTKIVEPIRRCEACPTTTTLTCPKCTCVCPPCTCPTTTTLNCPVSPQWGISDTTMKKIEGMNCGDKGVCYQGGCEHMKRRIIKEIKKL